MLMLPEEGLAEEGLPQEGQEPGKHRERASHPGPILRGRQQLLRGTLTARTAPPRDLGTSVEGHVFTLKQLLRTEALPRWSLCGSPVVAVPSLTSKRFMDFQAPPLSSGPAKSWGASDTL